MPFSRYILLVLSLIFSMTVFSAHLPDDIEAGDGINEIQLPLTKESAAELIRVESNGKILSVDEHKANGKKIFKIKVLHDNGKIKVYKLDPTTGHTP